MKTPYKKAWDKFQQSADCKRLVALMKEAEPRTRKEFFENRLRIAFDEGWNAWQQQWVCVYKDGSYKIATSGHEAQEYQNDSDWLITIKL